MVEVMPHEWLVSELLIQELVEKSGNFGAVHRLIEIRRHRRKINSLAKIILAPLFETLQENRHALLRSRFPVAIDEAPKIIR